MLMCGRGSEGLDVVRSQATSEAGEERESAEKADARARHAGRFAARRQHNRRRGAGRPGLRLRISRFVGPPLTLRTNELLGEVHLKGRTRA